MSTAATPSNHVGFEKVSIEQVMLYNPDVIMAQEKVFFDKVVKDPRWQSIKAVKEERCLSRPQDPFNSFDRPPSFMRVLGLKWLTNILLARQKNFALNEIKSKNVNALNILVRQFKSLFLIFCWQLL